MPGIPRVDSMSNEARCYKLWITCFRTPLIYRVMRPRSTGGINEAHFESRSSSLCDGLRVIRIGRSVRLDHHIGPLQWVGSTHDGRHSQSECLLVTVFSGTLNGWEVTLRDPGTYDNNNLLFPDGASFPDTGPTTSLVGHQGIAFLADGLSWRLFADPIAPHPMTLASICCFSRVDFSIEPATTAAVPEPGTWTMMLLGFGAAGFALRRRKQTELTFRRAA